MKPIKEDVVVIPIEELEKEKARIMERDRRLKGHQCIQMSIKHIFMADGSQRLQVELFDYTNNKHLGTFDVIENSQMIGDKVLGIPEAVGCYSDNFFIAKA